MLKFSISESAPFPLVVRNSIRSKWIALLVLLPLALFFLSRIYEPQLARFVESVLPKEPDKSYAFYQDFVRLCSTELLWITFYLAIAWLIGVYIPLFKIAAPVERSVIDKHRLYAAIIIGVSFIASIVISYFTLELFVNSSDEYAYLYQAETLSKGKLWEVSHKFPEFFSFNHIAHKEGINVGRFPPGWPLILSSAYFFGFPPFLVNPVLGALALFVFYRFARRFYGDRVAVWSLAVMALSAFFIFNSASYFSHTSCLLALLTFVYGTHLYLENGKIGYALLAGFALGLIVIIRYYTAVIIFIPFFLYIILQYRQRWFATFFWMGVGSIPCLALLFWYNYSITGNPLMPVTMWGYADESLGFVRGHTVAKGFEHVIRWSFMFFYWSAPGILILYAVYLVKKIKNKTERYVRPEDYFFLLLMIGYFFYYQIGGNQYGPRFFFESFPFVILFVVSRVFRYQQKLPFALLIVGVVYAIVKLPFIAQRENLVVRERKDMYDLVAQRHIRNAVVFVDYAGVIRPMPIGDLTRNNVDYSNDVLYAFDLKEKNTILMNYYPDKKFYKYIRDNQESPHGKLIEIR
jgi:hypothetical protein